jgi:hypothetical protein
MSNINQFSYPEAVYIEQRLTTLQNYKKLKITEEDLT